MFLPNSYTEILILNAMALGCEVPEEQLGSEVFERQLSLDEIIKVGPT